MGFVPQWLVYSLKESEKISEQASPERTLQVLLICVAGGFEPS